MMTAQETFGPPPSVTVIIVNFNGGRHIERCLAALFRQTVLPEQVIVVDNDSDDGSAEKIAAEYPQIRLLRQSSNIGFAAANNRALDHVGACEWLALLNPDTIPSPDWLKNLLSAAHDHPAVDVFSSKLLMAKDNRLLDGTGDVHHVSGVSWRRHQGLPDRPVSSAADPIFSACAAAALYRTDKFRQVGGFDEQYFCYHEDVDLGFRLRLAGCECLYVEQAMVEHVGSAIAGHGSDFTIYHGHRNLVWTYVKNMPGTLFWTYLPQHLILNLATIFAYCIQGRPGVILKAKWDAIKGIPAVLAKRRRIQKTSTASTGRIRASLAKGFLKPYSPRQRSV